MTGTGAPVTRPRWFGAPALDLEPGARRGLGIASLLGFAAFGCSTSLSGHQPAHVPDPGHVQTALGVDISVPSESVSQIIDATQELEDAAEERTLTEEERLEVFEGAAYFAMNSPAVSPVALVAVSPLRDFELSGRIASGNLRLGVRYQFLNSEAQGIDATIGLGGRFSFAPPPIDRVFETLSLDGFSRWALDVPLLFGRDREWFRWWAGPRVVYSRVHEELTVTEGGVSESGTVDGDSVYLAGTVGLAMGYDWIFMGPELTFAGLFGSARVSGLETESRVRVQSFIFHPSLALMMEF